jgi:hypothetical protein
MWARSNEKRQISTGHLKVAKSYAKKFYWKTRLN